jgi:hypothetical protein
VQVKTFPIDLGNAGPERDAAFQKLDGLLSELSVSVLGESSFLVGSLCFAIPDLGPRVHVACALTVNNAGVSHDMPVPFAESSMDENNQIIQVVSDSTYLETTTTTRHLTNPRPYRTMLPFFN